MKKKKGMAIDVKEKLRRHRLRERTMARLIRQGEASEHQLLAVTLWLRCLYEMDPEKAAEKCRSLGLSLESIISKGNGIS